MKPHAAIASMWARAKVDALMAQDLAAMQSGTFPKPLEYVLKCEHRIEEQDNEIAALERRLSEAERERDETKAVGIGVLGMLDRGIVPEEYEEEFAVIRLLVHAFFEGESALSQEAAEKALLACSEYRDANQRLESALAEARAAALLSEGMIAHGAEVERLLSRVLGMPHESRLADQWAELVESALAASVPVAVAERAMELVATCAALTAMSPSFAKMPADKALEFIASRSPKKPRIEKGLVDMCLARARREHDEAQRNVPPAPAAQGGDSDA